MGYANGVDLSFAELLQRQALVANIVHQPTADFNQVTELQFQRCI